MLTFLMRSDQTAQFIAVRDIGRIVAAVFADPGRFLGQTIPIASDAATGDQIAAAFSRAAAHPIAYRRLSEAVLAESAPLRGAATLFDDGRLAGNADLDALRKLVPGLYDFDAWLRGPGKPLLVAALTGEAAKGALC